MVINSFASIMKLIRLSVDNSRIKFFDRYGKIKIHFCEFVKCNPTILVIFHCHFHDNFGELDQHNAIGNGKEDWSRLVEACQRHAPNAVLVVECDRLKENKASVEKLRNLLTDCI